MSNDKPRKQYQELLDYIIESIDEIDNETVAGLGDHEPEWWCQMMVLRRSAQERKDRIEWLSDPDSRGAGE